MYVIYGNGMIEVLDEKVDDTFFSLMKTGDVYIFGDGVDFNVWVIVINECNISVVIGNFIFINNFICVTDIWG